MLTPLFSRVVGSLHDLHLVDCRLIASNCHLVAKRHGGMVHKGATCQNLICDVCHVFLAFLMIWLGQIRVPHVTHRFGHMSWWLGNLWASFGGENGQRLQNSLEVLGHRPHYQGRSWLIPLRSFAHFSSILAPFSLKFYGDVLLTFFMILNWIWRLWIAWSLWNGAHQMCIVCTILASNGFCFTWFFFFELGNDSSPFGWLFLVILTAQFDHLAVKADFDPSLGFVDLLCGPIFWHFNFLCANITYLINNPFYNKL